MLKRKAYDKLIAWKKEEKKNALCILGARQIGKTTLIREFGKKNYENFVEINFIAEKNANKIFEESFDANTIIRNLTTYIRKPMPAKKTLVLFDEIQECPNVRTAIKFLIEDGRFDYIESGSLLGVNYKEIKSYPVGFEEIFFMFPLDFEEFLWANGVQPSTIEYLQKCFSDKIPISKSIHDTISKLFYTYIIVGGMPEVVQNYINTNDIGKVIEIQKDILKLYRLDIAQYAVKQDKLKIKAIYDSIPSQLNDKKHRFYINSLNKNARLTRYDNCFKWLDDAGVALPCYNVNEPQPPLSLNEKHSIFKLFMNDTGLLCASCMDNVQLEILNGNLEINMGSILENIIAQQLIANNFNLYYYDSSKLGEIDFVIQNGMHIDLIEVKSGNNYISHKALDNILNINNWNFKNAYVLCKDNIKLSNNITYLPWYLVMFIRTQQIEKGLTYKVDISTLDNKK